MTASSTPGHDIIPDWTLGDRLRKARELCGYTQREMANLLGISQRAVSNYEKAGDPIQDGRIPRSQTVMAWAMATGVNVQWLANGKAPSPDGDGASTVRPKGFEPLTFCSKRLTLLTRANTGNSGRLVSSPTAA